MLYLQAIDSFSTLERQTRVEPTLSQPHQACWPYASYVNKRNSALNPSVPAGITQTAVLVQSSSYSRAVLFHCWEKFVISGWNHPALWLMWGIYQVIFSWLWKFSAWIQQMFSIRRH